jgi:poly(A) polymerase
MSGNPGSLLPESVRSDVLSLAGPAQVWMVGGAVRDAFIQRPVHDFDFAVRGDALDLGRRLAGRKGWDYFVLDAERQAGRVIERLPEGGYCTFDFSLLRGTDLDDDLQSRDFTINAMAVRLDEPHTLIDPLGGLRDLRAKRLRACQDRAVANDPVRALRGVRLAGELNLKIEPPTLAQLRQAGPALAAVASERVRDELFAILESWHPSTGVRLLQALELLEPALPAAGELERRASPDRLHSNALAHSLAVLASLEGLLSVLAGDKFDPETAADLILGQASLRLGRYRKSLQAHLETRLSADRRRRSLLMLSALLHPWLEGDPAHPSGNTSRPAEAETVDRALRSLRLSRQESKAVIGTMRGSGAVAGLDRHLPLGGGAIYRFFHDRGGAGVDSVLLSLADLLGSIVPPAPQSAWENRVETGRQLLGAWFEGPAEVLDPPALVRGDELAEELNLKPGPLLGRIVEAVRQGQAEGQIHSRAQAMAAARRAMADFGPGQPDP